MSEAGEGGEAGAARLPAKSFKLRFATQHELGRSAVSAVKPLGLPSVVRGKWCAAGREADGADGAGARAALRRVRALFRAGPRERLAAPATSAHELITITDKEHGFILQPVSDFSGVGVVHGQWYGWWWERGAQLEAESRSDPRLQHHIHDSAWLKERLRVLATDNGFQRR